ncbi:MAG: cytochrome c3 family protein, partial [Desulfovibrionaceae bacterium]|nr:cytochrome c3 family protein [Desulfovibrionaceae bacterium]
LADPAFGQAQRPAAVFDHDAHNEKAAIDGCLPCHHQGVEEGRFVEGDPVKCADCHEVKTAEGTPLMLAYHKQCEDCHLEKKKGPVTCGECHKRP